MLIIIYLSRSSSDLTGGSCMKGCSKFQYTEFNLEKQSIEFASDEGENLLIVIPITDDTPKCIINRLNKIISSSYD